MQFILLWPDQSVQADRSLGVKINKVDIMKWSAAEHHLHLKRLPILASVVFFILHEVRILGILRILIVVTYNGSLLSLVVRITALCASWQG